MKIIQSFWTKPIFHSERSLLDSRLDGGWPDKVLNYCSWALSCLQLRKFYRQVELITDEMGKYILIDLLQLPYSKVHVELNKIDNFHPGLWALGKLYAYNLQDEPFLHIDGDVFIVKRFTPRIFDAGVVSQNPEKNSSYSTSYYEITANYSYIPEYLAHLRKGTPVRGVNAGIIGGRNMAFLKEYISEAFRFVNNNLASINESIGRISVADLNCIIEQSIFYYLAQKQGIMISYLFESEIGDIGLFERADNNDGYIHCLGHFKKMPMVFYELEETLRSHYPEVYQRINDLVACSEL